MRVMEPEQTAITSCECALSGFCARRGIAISPTLQTVCQISPAKLDRILSGNTIGVPTPPKPARRGSSCRTGCSTFGTRLRAAIEEDIGRRINCGSCLSYLGSLDRCKAHDLQAVVKKIYAEIAWPPEWRARYGDKDGQRARMTELVNGVAAVCDVQQPVVKPRRTGGRNGRRAGRRPYTGWRSEADGPRIEHGPFVSSIRHLTYHVYAATKHDSWKWNLEQLAKRWPLFNGTRIIGISEGPEAQPASEVIAFAESIGLQFDHQVIRPNNPNLREVVTWVPMLSLLKPESAGANEVVFSAHAKGQKYDDPAHTRDWTDLMYQTCLDDWPAVYDALRTSLMAGSMREYGLLGKWHDWAYSGTFFWWRLAEIGKRNWRDVDQWFAGTESWPGKMCDPRETACLFLNDSRRMYDAHYWESTVWPEWRKYLEARNAG